MSDSEGSSSVVVEAAQCLMRVLGCPVTEDPNYINHPDDFMLPPIPRLPLLITNVQIAAEAIQWLGDMDIDVTNSMRHTDVLNDAVGELSIHAFRADNLESWSTFGLKESDELMKENDKSKNRNDKLNKELDEMKNELGDPRNWKAEVMDLEAERDLAKSKWLLESLGMAWKQRYDDLFGTDDSRSGDE